MRPLHPGPLGTTGSDSQRLSFDQSYHLDSDKTYFPLPKLN
jgi:hypothetical protein